MAEIMSAFGIDVRLLIIQVINFGLLLTVLWFFLYHPVMNMLETRREKIEKGVQDAESAEARLSEIENEKESIITAASQSANKIVETAKVRGGEKEREIVDEAGRKSERLLKEAEMKAEEAKRVALEESKEEIARLAILGAEKVLAEKTL